jgi:Mce-associated membrane protein
MTTTTTGNMTDEDEPRPTGAAEASIDATLAAEKAARKAHKAQLKADRLAAEARRLAGADAQAAADEAGPVPEAVGDEASEPAGGNRLPLVAAAVLLVACAAFLVAAVIVHVRGGNGSSQPASDVRDAALLAARQDIVVLNSLDYRNIDGGLNRWLDASTGELHASFEHVTADDRKRIADARAVTTAHVLEAAMISLDTANGHATVIASVELTVTPKSGKATIKRERQQADVTLVGGRWKVSGLQQVGVTVQ